MKGSYTDARAESSKTSDVSAKKKNKKNPREETTVDSKTTSSSAEKQKSYSISVGKKVNSKASHIRTYPNGLVVTWLRGFLKPVHSELFSRQNSWKLENQ